MNKNVITITGMAVFVMLFAGLIYFFSNQNSANQSPQESSTDQTTEERTNNNNQEDTNSSKTNSTDKTAPGDYQITDESSVSYIVQKRFLNRVDEEVTGTTTNVTGSGSFIEETGEFNINANVDLTTLDTGSGSRDNEVAEIFTPNNAVIIISSQDNPSFDTTQENQEIIANVTINNVTKQLPLTANIQLSDEEVSAKGETTFNMSEFDINPPSAVGIYTVDDETTVVFNISATK